MSLMFKPKTKVEKVCRWSLYVLMILFTSFMLYLRYSVYYNLTKPEFVKQVWSGHWMYLIGIIVVFTFLYVRSNLSSFKEMFK